MARRGRRPPPGKEIKAKLAIDPVSLKRFEQALLELKQAAREDAIDEALMAGAKVVKAAQQKRAPGPYIEIEFVKNVASLAKGGASGLMKKTLSGHARYVAIGPDKAHWYYRFRESGSKVHGAKRKRTRYQQFASKNGIKARDLRTFAKMGNRKAGRLKPAMSWVQNGERVFVRMVRGISANPFVRPSVDENEAAINGAMIKVLRSEIEKAAKGK
jgi:HK97 gp10 family phage protein